ncbi:DEAD/DEAH box helicase [Corynebacterium mendelii]|uniref:DEAD/DEAH box helicase n=1 Tax=Corynebacterium mendelii TaxID=2765362 RepID=A0A939DZ56_9CORY|nr:DEAD/DEAH box helicase [Corynebacterium mendelii]MBN9643515.1 DEAD/DEAH box helicase [Corynebacterium mendelii]
MTDNNARTAFFDSFSDTLDFEPDQFQVTACRSVDAGRGVLVCAPTGAGKTVVGEFAVHKALAEGTKCFYTTPIKALSNQKYHDFVAAHGAANIGLLTGDVSINGRADVVVMTTEVLRNMIYAGSEALDRLAYVVMDEIHYLADRSRGPVWEEVILNLDESVTVIGLSATVSNAEEFGAWLETVRGDTDIVVTETRPVPLDQWMMVGGKLHPLLKSGATGEVNNQLIQAISTARKTGPDTPQEFGATTAGSRRNWEPRGKRNRHTPRRAPSRMQRRAGVLRILEGKNMLPAITFIFSRAGCDDAVFQCLRSRLDLTNAHEKDEIARIVDHGVEGIDEQDLAVLNFPQFKKAACHGIAAHHAGMLPAFRHIVEDLFTQGLLKAVFATETLALGINMPARTVILEKLVKYNGEAHVDLTPGEYTQLTGRAGRRGIDVMGNAVVLWTPSVDAEFVAGLASTRTYPLISTFRPGYNMAVNLINTIGFQPAHRLLEKSFAQFQTDVDVVADTDRLERAEKLVAATEGELRGMLGRIPFDERMRALLLPAGDGDDDRALHEAAFTTILDYIELRQKLNREEKAFHRRRLEMADEMTMQLLDSLVVGDIIAWADKKKKVHTGIVTKTARPGTSPEPWVTSGDGWHGRLHAAQLKVPPQKIGHTQLKKHKGAPAGRRRKYEMEALFSQKITPPRKLRAPKPKKPKTLDNLAVKIRQHPGHRFPHREEIARVAERLVKARVKLRGLEKSIGSARDTLGRTFDRIVGLLAEYGYVEFAGGATAETGGTPSVTPEGENLARIHNESDLLVAQCLRRGIWNDLDPAELAGAVSMCVFETRKQTSGRPDAPTERLADAMNGITRIYGELAVDEQRWSLPGTREPDGGFSLAIHQWTAGAPMDYCMAAAAACGAELTPGDFVRWCRQVIDLLEQVAATGYTEEITRNARRAIDAIRRGVVAIGA